jgi:tRNA A-37 threonylcarbamoyl transferase component Bud32
MAQNRVHVDRFPPSFWITTALVLLTSIYAVLQVGFVRPYLWPAGHGAVIAGEPASRRPLTARPPDPRGLLPGTITAIADKSPADRAGLHVGDVVARETLGTREVVDFSVDPGNAAAVIDVWRHSYSLGVSSPVTLDLQTAADARATATSRRLELPRDPAWKTAAPGWPERHLGMIAQVVAFTIAAIALLVLRSNDLTAQLSVLALALSGVAGGGPLLGVERVLPLGLSRVMTIFTWLAGPLAFPIIALAILHFPSPSALLRRHPWLRLVPFAAAAPMILFSAGTSLYLVGADPLRAAALWDAVHPGVSYGSFAVALGINVAAVGEGLYRFRFVHDMNERRRIRMAVYTGVPAVLAYAVKEGIPIVAGLLGASPPRYSWPVSAFLQTLVLLPAFGLPYAVGVARVLGPRLVLRRSIQYALASRTLSIVAIAPAALLTVSVARNSDKTIGQIVGSGSGVYIVLLLATVGAFKYRERARQWLDQRFFREEYDARKILLSLVSRVRFETDPSDLAALIVHQIDEALHPDATAMLVSGVEEGRVSPVASRGRAMAPLPLDGGLVTMLRWSDEPLDILLEDPRSPARRLPTEEVAWLHATRVALLVPIMGQDRALVGLLALGPKRSEEAYSTEDRELLASIAGQVSLGLDVARLRRRSQEQTATTKLVDPEAAPMVECPRCGRCEDSGVALCPSDATPMQPAGRMTRVIDNKYKIEQLIGRGGMGAVYRARDMRLDRLVALKVVRAELLQDTDARRRFRREAQIVARLQHPGIVSIFDFGTFADGGAYLVMELVRGEDLRRVLEREGRLETPRAVRIVTAVCNAIEAAHQDGVLHRDLKPENIVLPGGAVEAKVLDFGVAKLLFDKGNDSSAEPGSSTLTVAGAIVGTPAYMAPEQLRGEPPDARTDVFALGVIAYEMLTGDLPFGRGAFVDVALAQNRGAERLATKAAQIPAPLDAAILRALEIDRDKRPPTAQAFAATVLHAVEP